MKKKISVSFILFFCFILSIIYALFSIHYKIRHYGFSINPNSKVDVWLVEAKILYEALGGPVNISMSVPNDKFILADTIKKMFIFLKKMPRLEVGKKYIIKYYY